MQLENTLTAPLTLRASASSYVILMTIPGALSVLYGFIAIHNRAAWGISVSLLLATLAITLWLASFRLVLTARSISYRTLFRSRTILLPDIAKAEIHIGVRVYRDRFRPTIRLELAPQAALDAAPLIINLKVFDKDGLDELFRFLPITRPGGSNREVKSGE